MERENPTITSDKSLGNVSFGCGRQGSGFTPVDAGVIPTEEHLIVQHHCIDHDIVFAAAVVRNTK